MGHRIHPRAIREYDIRGRVGDTLDADDARAVGRSFATRVIRAGGRRIVVGRDGRTHSPMLEAALVEGLVASGADVIRTGVGSTPMLYHAEQLLGVDAGVQVTGSHNPPGDNGFKLVHRHRSVFGTNIVALADMAAAGDWETGCGSMAEDDVLDRYVDRLTERFTGGSFRIAWDCGNGAAGPAVERLTARLPGEHRLLFADVDGDFPHHHPDPTVEANLADLKRVVLEHGLDFGVAFDGDGDRIGVVDTRGRVVWGDQLLAILAEPVLAAYAGAAIVADVKASDTLFERIAALGGRPVMARTGHSLMKAKMHETGAPLGGEMSGHVFFGEADGGFDDALLAAVRLLGAVHASGQTLAALRDRLPLRVATPDLRLACDDEAKFAIVARVLDRLTAMGVEVNRTDGARVRTADGWWLLRASNTEAALTLRAEARDRAGLNRLLDTIDAQLAPEGVSIPRGRDPT